MSHEERMHYLSIIEKESRRLSALSKQLLTLSLLDREQVLSEKTVYNLSEQLKDVIMTMEWQWQEKNITVDLAQGSIEVEGERRLLHQARLTLFTNEIRE